MKVSDIPYKYACKERGDNCMCSTEQMKVCPSAKRIIDEYQLIKILEKENKKPFTSSRKGYCKHLVKDGRFKGEAYCQVYKGICKCKK